MSDDDDDSEPQVVVVKDYYFVDADKNALCFSVLPIWFKEDAVAVPECKTGVFLRGTVDPGIPVYKQVVAWKLGLDARQPDLAVLSKEGGWINLSKPKNSYEESFRTIFITVQMLHFLRRKPEEPEKDLWIHLRKVFDKFDVRPSKDDFRNHHTLMKQFAEKDLRLANSEILKVFIGERFRKQISEVDSGNFEVKESFIAADEDVEDIVADDNVESDEDGDDDLFDSTCAICDNGGDLLGCDGPCMRSFHAKIGTGEDSYCQTLGFTEAEVEAMKTFLCKNCEYKQHQCFICGVLEPSDGPTAKVFLCNNATCGYFYHPKCVAQQLHPNNKIEALEKEKKIAGGSSFTCSIHWCFCCKGLEDRTEEHLQFAVCRRCPKSYHRKCLPSEIPFEDSDEDIVTRAWDLSQRILIYCMEHEIDLDIETPVRNHIKFPGLPIKPTEYLKKKTKVLIKKKKRTFDESFLDEPSIKPAKFPGKVRVQENEHARKIAVRSSSEQLVEKPEKKKVKLLKQRTQPESNMVRDAAASSPKHANKQEKYWSSSTSSTTMNMPQSSFPIVDSETERRVIALVEKEVSSLTLNDISRKCLMPSTHVYSGRQTDKIIATGKLERSVQAVRQALHLLAVGDVNTAKATCEPQVLKQLARWHMKLKVYISPFIYGSRYSSFGRHFTKVEKLVEIVDKLHWYVEPGDMIVDFCCGANDFSRLMKEKLDLVQKKCHFKNYDLIQPQNTFCFERRDWMTVQRNELPRGSRLVMGLNPPFGVKAALANKFIDKALSFNPKLIILIVPKETKRLDQKKTPYDLVWEDGDCLAGKSFYLPGSVDVNEKIVQGWNASAPPLYLWSHPDWTKKHKKVAEEHNHTSLAKIACRIEEGNLSDDVPMKKEAESSDVHNSRPRKEDENTGRTSCHLEEASLSNVVPVQRQAEPKSKQNARSGKAKWTKERTSCDVRDVIPSDETLAKKQDRSGEDQAKEPNHLVQKQSRSGEDKAKEPNRLVKKQARFGEEKDKERNRLVKKQARSGEDKYSNLAGGLSAKNQAEAALQQMCRSGKHNSRDGSKSSDDRSRKRTPDEVDSLPPEKQVEVAFEERRAPIKMSIQREQRDAFCENLRNDHIKEPSRGSSDMNMSSPDTSNAPNRSTSYSPYMPTEQPSEFRPTAYLDGNMSYPVKEPHVSAFSSATYQGSYLARSDRHNDALGVKNDPMLYTHAVDGSKYSPSFEELTMRYAANPAGDGYSMQAQGDDYLPMSRHSLGSSGARYDQPSLRSYYGLSGTTAPQSSITDKYGPGLFGPSGSGASVTDKYAPGFLGPSAPGSSVIDNYAAPLNGTNYATQSVIDMPGYGREMPPQYPYRGPGSSGGGLPYT